MIARKNAYWCEACGGYTVTVDVDEGATPLFLVCRAKGGPTDSRNGCAALARSLMYPAEPWPERDGFGHVIPTEPAWEWYRPGPEEADALDRGMFEHVPKGGLFLRRIDQEAKS